MVATQRQQKVAVGKFSEFKLVADAAVFAKKQIEKQQVVFELQHRLVRVRARPGRAHQADHPEEENFDSRLQPAPKHKGHREPVRIANGPVR